MPNLVNLVYVTVDPSVKDELLDKLWTNVHAAREEEHCYQFDVSVSNDDPNTFIFYEIYKDAEALAWHKEQDYFLNYINYVEAMGEKVNRNFKQYSIIDK